MFILDQEEKEKINFSVDNRLIKELGEKLVTRNYLALAELIKNSYDADSDKVEVIFKDVKSSTSSGKIIIRDYGIGMTWDQFINNWMRVSTDNKENHPVSLKYGRKKSGSKGIGRFSCQKLASSINIKTISETTTPNIVQVTIVDVEWDNFVDGQDLVKTFCDATRFYTKKENVTLGTELTLKGLKQDWNQLSYNNLQRQLASLSISSPTRRDGYIEDPGFDISVSADEFESQDYKLSEKVLDSGWGRVQGSVSEDGTVEINFHGKLIGKREHCLADKFHELKHAKFDITFISDKKSYQRNPQLMTLQQMRQIRELYSGVKVYSEGFRVYPYGQPGDDWLGLDRDVGRRKAKIDNLELRKIAAGYGLDTGRTMLDLFSNRAIIGSVNIDTNLNPSFEIKLNREGFVSNPAFSMLTKLLRYIVEWMTIQYSYFKFIYAEQEKESAERELIEHLSTPSDEKPQHIHFQQALSAILNEVKQSIDLATDGTSSKEIASEEYIPNPRSKNIIEAASKYIQKEYDSNKNELTLLRAIASTGPLFFVFAHEFKSLVSRLDTDAGKIEQWCQTNGQNTDSWLLDIATSLRTSRKRFLSLENLIGVFASTHKTDLKKIKIKDAVEKVCDGFEFITSGSAIKIDYSSIDERLKSKDISDAALYSILVNLISNSIKAVMAKGVREIKIRASRNDKLSIFIEDKGIGLSKDKWDDVFLPLVTDPSGEMYKELYGQAGNDELAVLGRGTGLGLTIVKGMVQDSGGTVSFTPPSAGWSTCIEVKLP
ncbi:MAG: ATP-binding protein [Aeromonas caviae]|nr:ATP-binding protein [Aeromonas caviae]